MRRITATAEAYPMATTSATTGTGPVTVLPLPGIGELTEQQVRGQACVWDAVPLSGVPAVDLGPQTAARAGSPVRWFPRGCPSCVASRAHRALLDHASSCEQCAGDGARCGTGLDLNRLIRQARRS
ncbi:hypothetical protein [Streptomyces sp. SAS_275]|uniref:hypothetical protein n=1 Tax=Streptomyces sp. SAS_275 TaxID=3412746 RepID=UPI00403D1D4C